MLSDDVAAGDGALHTFVMFLFCCMRVVNHVSIRAWLTYPREGLLEGGLIPISGTNQLLQMPFC